MKKIILDNVYYSVKGVEIIKGISLVIEPGESLVICGLSGSGKSTLLKLCAGIYQPTEGNVIINGVDIHQIKRKKRLELMDDIGYVFQGGGLITNINVFDNIALALRYHKMNSEVEIALKVEEEITKFSLESVREYFPGTLSPGQKKLTGFAAEIITKPNFLFFDDPTTSIDSYIIRKFIDLINDHVKEGKSAVTVTHNQEFTDAIASTIAIVSDGRIAACGDPETIKSSDNTSVKQVLKSVSAEKELADEFLKMMGDDDDFF